MLPPMGPKPLQMLGGKTIHIHIYAIVLLSNPSRGSLMPKIWGMPKHNMNTCWYVMTTIGCAIPMYKRLITLWKKMLSLELWGAVVKLSLKETNRFGLTPKPVFLLCRNKGNAVEI